MGLSPRTPQARLVPLLLLALLVGPCASCSANRVRLYPVRGQVLYKSRPVERAMVVFHPVGELPAGVPKPIAYTDAAGRFQLTTNKPGDGVPAGEYLITVEQREKTRTGVEKIGGRNLLPARYSKPESSGLHCQVREGENELEPFNLTDN